jgi:magnesium-transporting ATPase (P-type)
MPITAPQVLWVNMVTSVALGLVVAFEPHEREVMSRPPRSINRSNLDGFWDLARCVRRFGSSGFYARCILRHEVARRLGHARPYGRGKCHHYWSGVLPLEQPLSAGQLSIDQAHLRNKYLAVGIGAVVILQLLFTYASSLQALFDKRTHSALGLALAVRRRPCVFPRRRSRKTINSKFAERRNGARSGGIISTCPLAFWWICRSICRDRQDLPKNATRDALAPRDFGPCRREP